MHAHRFGLFPFRSPLLWESFLFSFPSGTEMFHFPESRSYMAIYSPYGNNLSIIGFPHSDIYGSFRVLTTPRSISLFAASFFACKCLGIHHTPLFVYFFDLSLIFLHIIFFPKTSEIFFISSFFCIIQFSTYFSFEHPFEYSILNRTLFPPSSP